MNMKFEGNHESRKKPEHSFFEKKTGEYLKQIERLKKDLDLCEKDFPIGERGKEIINAILENDTVLIQAETGAGKSLDIGKFVMDAIGREVRIAMTQPRRDAAEGSALAISARHGLEFGKDISFSTSEYKGNKKNIPFQIQTTAILLNQLKSDPMLEEKDVVIIDEAHERDLNIDLCMGLLKRANELREKAGMDPIKTIICSATLPEEKFKEFFNIKEEASFNIEGRMHKVEKNFLPEDEKYRNIRTKNGDEKIEVHYADLAVARVKKLLEETETGDILVFMPGIKQIRRVIERLGNEENVNVMRLYGGDSMEHRNDVLKKKKKGGKRRVIVSTNMAETSVTVHGIVHVVDSCRKNENVYDVDTRLSTLTDVPASKSECKQRAGRAGRVEPGNYYSLITEDDSKGLEKYPKPEIERSNLSGIVFKMISMGIKDIEDFDFVDKPKIEKIRAAIQELTILGLIDENRDMTRLGKSAEKIPMDPRMATVVATSIDKGCLRQVLAITSLMDQQIVSEVKPRKVMENGKMKKERITEIIKRKEEFEKRRLKLKEGIDSEWVYYLNVFNKYKEEKRKNNEGNFCNYYGLNKDAIERAMIRYNHILKTLAKSKISTLTKETDKADENITQSILAGFAPDHLFVSDGDKHGIKYNRVYDDDNSVRLCSSCTLKNERKPEMAVSLNFRPGDAQKENASFIYANIVHPISSKQLKEAVPQCVKQEETPYKHVLDRGNVMSLYRIQYKNKYGMYKKIPDNTIFERTPATGRFLAQYFLYEDEAGEDIKGVLKIQENKEKLETIKKYRLRSMGQIDLIDLEDFYAGKFGNIATANELGELIKNKTEFDLKMDEICSDEQIQKIEHSFPVEVTIKSKVFKISYTEVANEFKAKLVIDDRGECRDIEDKDIPKIGEKKNIDLYISFNDQRNYLDIKTFKEKENPSFSKDVFDDWNYLYKTENKKKPEGKTPFKVGAEIPPLTKEKKEIGTDLYNAPISAYPAVVISAKNSYAKELDNFFYEVKYFDSEESATRATKEMEEKKVELETQEKDKEKADEAYELYEAKIGVLRYLLDEISKKSNSSSWYSNTAESINEITRCLYIGAKAYRKRENPKSSDAIEEIKKLESELLKMKEEIDKDEKEKLTLRTEAFNKFEKTEELANKTIELYEKYNHNNINDTIDKVIENIGIAKDILFEYAGREKSDPDSARAIEKLEIVERAIEYFLENNPEYESEEKIINKRERIIAEKISEKGGVLLKGLEQYKWENYDIKGRFYALKEQASGKWMIKAAGFEHGKFSDDLQIKGFKSSYIPVARLNNIDEVYRFFKEDIEDEYGGGDYNPAAFGFNHTEPDVMEGSAEEDNPILVAMHKARKKNTRNTFLFKDTLAEELVESEPEDRSEKNMRIVPVRQPVEENKPINTLGNILAENLVESKGKKETKAAPIKQTTKEKKPEIKKLEIVEPTFRNTDTMSDDEIEEEWISLEDDLNNMLEANAELEQIDELEKINEEVIEDAETIEKLKGSIKKIKTKLTKTNKKKEIKKYKDLSNRLKRDEQTKKTLEEKKTTTKKRRNIVKEKIGKIDKNLVAIYKAKRKRYKTLGDLI